MLPLKWHTLRPEELRPEDFLELTADLFGERPEEQRKNLPDQYCERIDPVWRKTFSKKTSEEINETNETNDEEKL